VFIKKTNNAWEGKRMKEMHLILFKALVSELGNVFLIKNPTYELTTSSELVLTIDTELKNTIVECENAFLSCDENFNPAEITEENCSIAAEDLNFIQKNGGWELRIDATNLLEFSGLNQLLMSALRRIRKKKSKRNITRNTQLQNN